MYLFLFLVALPGQFLFGVTTMTMSAVVTTYLFGLAYYAVTGTYFFFDSYIPIAVFLGMHLLFTDPSTAPRTELGRVIFGALYGLSIVALYELLGAAGLPDLLRQAPSGPAAQPVDQGDRPGGPRDPLRRFEPAASGPFAPVPPPESGVRLRLDAGFRRHERTRRRRRFAIVDSGFLSGSRPAAAGSRPRLSTILRSCYRNACSAGSGWSCNELGMLQAQGGGDDRPAVFAAIQEGCTLGFQPACDNTVALNSGGPRATGPPPVEDLPILCVEARGRLPIGAPRRFTRAPAPRAGPVAAAPKSH